MSLVEALGTEFEWKPCSFRLHTDVVNLVKDTDSWTFYVHEGVVWFNETDFAKVRSIVNQLKETRALSFFEAIV